MLLLLTIYFDFNTIFIILKNIVLFFVNIKLQNNLCLFSKLTLPKKGYLFMKKF